MSAVVVGDLFTFWWGGSNGMPLWHGAKPISNGQRSNVEYTPW